MLNALRKTVLGIAYFFYFGGTITLIGLVIKDYVGEDVLINGDLAALPGCYASGVPSIIAGFWIGPLIVETVLFIIVVSRAFLWWKEGTTIPRILSILTKDSTTYFAIVFALLLANYLVFELGPPFFSSLLVTPSITAGCILGSHIFLNLRAMSLDVEFEDIDFNNPSYEYSTSGPNQSHRRSHFIVVPMPLTHMRRPRYGWGTNTAEGDKEREGDDGVVVSVKTEVEVNADDEYAEGNRLKKPLRE
ncbi:hypothetical protein D9611_002731 [Ephemerocybe angulata]|uniref:Uncharacterized protein n=1 Tax=Ephemerocybe angulata TaxID=980116 RepID=A0A8H5FDW9_9AGAR|nr:hypothetical protein D9611_002731 [Tulosesus angulatus]